MPAPRSNTPSTAALAQRSAVWPRALGLTSLLGLIVLILGWELWWAPLRPGGSSLVFKVVPLLMALPGLLKNRMYTYRWVSLLVWLYFIEGVVRAYSERAPSNYYAMLQILLCLSLFTACALHVRWRLQTPANTSTKHQTTRPPQHPSAHPAQDPP